MADIGKTVKEIWEQGMKAVNKAATNIATSTKQKVDEMNIVTRGRNCKTSLVCGCMNCGRRARTCRRR